MKKTAFVLLFFLTIFIPSIGLAGIEGSREDTTLLSLPKVDKRVELLSIVFRLAGRPEYNQEQNKNYVNDIHKHFDKYKNHPLIAFAKELIDSNGIGYDAVMALAIHIKQPPALTPVVPFNDSVPEERWGAKDAHKFISLLQKFYVDAECEEFFKEEETTYRIAEEKFKIVYDNLDISWYKKFYGQVPEGKFNIVIGLGNGGANYGCKVIFPDKKEQIYAIMGTWSVDSLGQPEYQVNDYLPTLIHEFNHSFVNYLIYKNEKIFKDAGASIYSHVAGKMQMQAYGNWKIMICEAIVRASVIEYLKSHDTANGNQAEKETLDQLNNGFLWMREQVALLDTYEANRQKYPTLESYIPELATFYTATAKNFVTLKENYARLCPHVLSIEQFKNNDTNVSPSLTEIKINFDKALKGKGYSFGNGKKGKEFYPKIKVKGYCDNNTAIEIQVTLKPNTEYQFLMMGMGFKTPEGYPLENYEVSFKTAK